MQTKIALAALSKGSGGSMRTPPTSLEIAGTPSSDRGDWAAALKELATAKFTADDAHRAGFTDLLARLRSSARSNQVDGRSLGAPSFAEFVEQITRLRDDATPGPDLLPGRLTL